MSVHPTTAFVLAAGKGTRMQSHASDRPKPLVEIAGRTLMDRVLDNLNAIGVKCAVVNVHHMADMLEQHLTRRQGGPSVAISDERAALLETGGGVVKALPLLGPDPIFVINSDALWQERPQETQGSLLRDMQTAFDPEKMDILLSLVPVEAAHGYHGRGDFHRSNDGQLSRIQPGETAPYIFAGVQIIRPQIMTAYPMQPFSMNIAFDDTIKTGRLFGHVHNGPWYHVGSPAEVKTAEAAFETHEKH